MTQEKDPPKWRPTRRARVLRGKDAFLRWLLALLEAGMYPRAIRLERGHGERRTIDAGDGAPDRVPVEISKRATAKRGRPRARLRAGETRDEQVKRLARERVARYRARKRQNKEQSQ